MLTIEQVYAPIRKMTTGEKSEFVIFGEISGSRREASQAAKMTDKRIVVWAEENPVQRIAEFTLTEQAG